MWYLSFVSTESGNGNNGSSCAKTNYFEIKSLAVTSCEEDRCAARDAAMKMWEQEKKYKNFLDKNYRDPQLIWKENLPEEIVEEIKKIPTEVEPVV